MLLLCLAVLPACLAPRCWHERYLQAIKMLILSRNGCYWMACCSLLRSNKKICNKSTSELVEAERLSGHEWHTWSSNQQIWPWSWVSRYILNISAEMDSLPVIWWCTVVMHAWRHVRFQSHMSHDNMVCFRMTFGLCLHYSTHASVDLTSFYCNLVNESSIAERCLFYGLDW